MTWRRVKVWTLLGEEQVGVSGTQESRGHSSPFKVRASPDLQGPALPQDLQAWLKPS